MIIKIQKSAAPVSSVYTGVTLIPDIDYIYLVRFFSYYILQSKRIFPFFIQLLHILTLTTVFLKLSLL